MTEKTKPAELNENDLNGVAAAGLSQSEADDRTETGALKTPSEDGSTAAVAFARAVAKAYS